MSTKRRVLSAALMLSATLAAFAAMANNTVTIKRDNYGTPHIYADDAYGLFYGYGYAIAQDRLFQMEMAKRSTQGQVAQVLGADYLDFDKKTRVNYDPASVMAQLAALGDEDRAIFDGYAAGVNAWIAQIRSKPNTLMPKQFLDFGFKPEDWSSFDVAMIFIGSMGNRFGDFNTELQNQLLLNAMIKAHGEQAGRAIFDQINPRTDSKAPTTISAQDWQVPAVKAASAQLSVSVVAKTLIGSDLSALDPAIVLANAASFSGFSNMAIIGKNKAEGAKAILLNGPQFGWYTPAYTYSVGLHGAGFDLVGNTPFGYPAVLFGYNRDISWGGTWGAGDVVDLYRETLNPDNPHEYLFNGEYLPMDRRVEIIRVKGTEAVEVEVLKTVHGLVVNFDRENGVAYTKKRAWAGRELDTLLGWVYLTRAQNFEEWIAQAARSAMNINLFYADKDGNIGYVFTGAYPARRPDHDNRLPASGEGDMEWRGIKPFDTNPQVFNPTTGYIANWNNKPGAGVLNPDEFWYSWSTADRAEVLSSLLEAKERFTAEEIRQLLADAALMDVNARYFIPYIERATAELADNDPRRLAARTLTEWDYFSRDADRDGHYDSAATAIFQTWLPLMLEATFKDDLGEFFKWFASAGYPAPDAPPRASLNVQIGTKALYNALLGQKAGVEQRFDFFNGQAPLVLIRHSLEAALVQLKERFGGNRADWRLPVARLEFTNTNFLGIPQAGADEIVYTHIAMNRGTENNQTIFTNEGIVGYEVVPPGQSGFIAPDGAKSKHYANQLKLYDEFDYKRTWLDTQDVDKNTVTRITLTY